MTTRADAKKRQAQRKRMDNRRLLMQRAQALGYPIDFDLLLGWQEQCIADPSNPLATPLFKATQMIEAMAQCMTVQQRMAHKIALEDAGMFSVDAYGRAIGRPDIYHLE